jgi:hypothetical protein
LYSLSKLILILSSIAIYLWVGNEIVTLFWRSSFKIERIEMKSFKTRPWYGFFLDMIVPPPQQKKFQRQDKTCNGERNVLFVVLLVLVSIDVITGIPVYWLLSLAQTTLVVVESSRNGDGDGNGDDSGSVIVTP